MPKVALSFVLAITFLRLPSLLAAHCIDDENIYAVVGIEIAHGGLPYVSAIERKPPLLLYLYGAVLRCFGDYNFFALHAVATLWTLATMAAIYAAARDVVGKRAGAIAALAYGLFLPFNVYRNLAWNGEMLMNLPLALAVWLTLANSQSRARLGLIAAGAMVALATLLKQPAAIALAALVFYVLLPSYRARRSLSLFDSLLHAGWLGIGFAATLALAAFALMQLGILREALFWSVGHHDVPHGPLDPVFWERAIKGVAAFSVACAPLCAGAWVMSRRRVGDAFAGREAERAALIVLLVVSAIGTAASGRFYPHYFIQMLLPLTLLAAPWFLQLWEAGPSGRTFRVIAAWTTISVLAFFVSHSIGYWQARQSGAVAQYVRQHARLSDRMFVWGQAPELYLECRLRPASRYVATFPLTGYVFASPIGQDPSIDTTDRIVPGSWETLAGELSARLPDLIVDADGARPQPRYPIRNYPLLRKLLDEQYTLVLKAPDGLVYARSAVASR